MPEQNVAVDATQTVLGLDGDLTASSAELLRPKIKQLVAKGTRSLAVDMTRCAMADSTGIGLLVATHNSLSKAGGVLSLIHVCKNLRDLFQTLRLQQHFSITE